MYSDRLWSLLLGSTYFFKRHWAKWMSEMSNLEMLRRGDFYCRELILFCASQVVTQLCESRNSHVNRGGPGPGHGNFFPQMFVGCMSE